MGGFLMEKIYMSAEHKYRVEWQDPTAERAIGLVVRSGKRSRFFPNGNSSIHEQRYLPPQAEIDGAIHTLKIDLADGRINRAFYKEHVDKLRSQLRNIRKGGE